MLKLLEDELRDDESPVDEPGFDDVLDPSVDDRARVDDDVRIARRRDRFPVVPGPSDEPDGLGGDDQILALRDGQAEHAEPKEERHADWQPRPERRRKECQRQAEQQSHQQAEEEPDNRSHELRRRELLDLADQPDGRHDGQVRQNREADDDPGDDPGDEQRPAGR